MLTTFEVVEVEIDQAFKHVEGVVHEKTYGRRKMCIWKLDVKNSNNIDVSRHFGRPAPATSEKAPLPKTRLPGKEHVSYSGGNHLMVSKKGKVDA